MGVGTAQAKLLLFGEHAAVYGHPAVGRALPWSLTIEHVAGSRWDLPGLGHHTDAVLSLLDRLSALAAEERLPLPTPGVLRVQTEIPLESGFGSSGALCAALVNLFWPDLPLTDRDRLAWKAEGLFHGTPSGIDTALALRQGWWILQTHTKPVTAVALPDPGLILVAGAVVRESDTKTLVGTLARRRAEGDTSVVAALDRLGSLSARAGQQLAHGQSAEIPALVAEARYGLASLGLESPSLTKALEAGLSCAGAQAGKLSGAGGGGAFFLLFADEDSAQAARPVIEAALPDEFWTSRPRTISPTASALKP